MTIFGVNEADFVVGQLTRDCFTDFLPLLGGYVVANNQITHELPGFALYNITDGIQATDVAGWFCRWLLCRNLTSCSARCPTAKWSRSRPRAASSLTTLRPPRPRAYAVARVVAWAAFAAHAISLGMATLVSQILAVILLTAASVVATRERAPTGITWGRGSP